MDSANEESPLLHTADPIPKRKILRNICLKIPTEVTITGVIVGLFLSVVALLVLLENFQSSSDKEFVLDKVEDGLLGSPFKYNKKALDKSWQDKKNSAKSGKYSDNKKWDNAEKGWKKISKTGWRTTDDTNVADTVWEGGQNLLKSQMDVGNMKWKKIDRGWKKLSNRSVAAPSSCPFKKVHSNPLLGAPVPQSKISCALLAEKARLSLGRCVDLSFLPKKCKPTWRQKCFTTYKYRKLDGSCNNIIHPTWGKSGTPFVRMVAPDYGDGASSIRTSSSGGELPNARFLSQKLYSEKMKPDSEATILFLNFGLLVDHDMVQTAIDTNGIPCCDLEMQKSSESLPKECLQIDVPENDPFYGPRNVKCLNLVRSIPVHGQCIGRREQLNKATSFLDGSAIYGSTVQQTKVLRSFSRGYSAHYVKGWTVNINIFFYIAKYDGYPEGQLRTQLINNTPYMTFSEGDGYSCGTPTEPLKCFAAGDPRVNMLVELTVMHTLWYREHNRLADELNKINPHLTDEILFQEARKILIAELQHITYNEFLPLLLGEDAMNEYELKIDNTKEYEGYDDTVDPSVFNVFGSAAFRFGHSLAQGTLDLIGPDNRTEGRVLLHETFFNPQLLYHNGLDLLLRGAAFQRAHSVDSYITNEVREHLFQPADRDYGHDLAAVGIQRGRDHGLPSYPKWREVCGLGEIKTWDDLLSAMDLEHAEKLKEAYESVDDIDLIPGALSENHVEGSLLGPTYLCIIGRQFKKTRKGDRFWFERQNELISFTEGQLKEIYKSNMARIICDNSDSIDMIQKHPFRIPSGENPVRNCDEIPKLDLSQWQITK